MAPTSRSRTAGNSGANDDDSEDIASGSTPPANSSSATNDTTHPAILHVRINNSTWDDNALLDFDLNNWTPWSRRMRNILTLSGGLEEYIDGFPPAFLPNAITQPLAARNWKLNDNAVCAYIHTKCAESEHDFIEDLPAHNAHELWSALEKRHANRGPISQIRLIQDAFNIKYSELVRFAATTKILRQFNDRIWAMGTPTKEVFLTILMLNAMYPYLMSIQNDVSNGLTNATDAHPYGPKEIANRLETAQQVLDSNTARGYVPPPAEALATTSNAAAGNRSLCSNCKRSGHIDKFCVKPGGGMAGKTIAEAQAARLAEKAAAKAKTKAASSNTKATPAVYKDREGRAFTIDNAGSVNYVDTVPEAHFTRLQTDDLTSVIDPILSTSMTAEDIDEYVCWIDLQDELTASVDWNSSSRLTDTAGISVSPIDNASRTEMDLTASPFLLDSGASTHISPERSDFFDLRPISHRVVRGVGGSSISAIGIGSIRLRIGKGSTLLLGDVLFIPNSTVRLLSIARITASLHGRVSFGATDVTIHRNSGAIIATGSLIAARNLYSLNCSRLLADHALIANRIPTLDTWHRRLGHANNQAILDLAKKRLAQVKLLSRKYEKVRKLRASWRRFGLT